MSRIIPYQNTYKKQIMQFIDTVYKEYGDQLYTKGFDHDLLDIENIYNMKEGKFWLYISDNNQILGTLAFQIKDKDAKIIEMKRFYVRKDKRGSGIADQLYEKVINWCFENNYKRIILWSDKRFTRSHTYYLKMGYSITGERDMNDGAMPYSEYCFEYNLI